MTLNYGRFLFPNGGIYGQLAFIQITKRLEMCQNPRTSFSIEFLNGASLFTWKESYIVSTKRVNIYHFINEDCLNLNKVQLNLAFSPQKKSDNND